MHLQGRVNDLHIYCQEPLKEIVEIQLKYSETLLRYRLHFHFLNPIESELIYEDEEIEVRTIILSHRIPCTGFLFSEKPGFRKLIKEKLKQYNIPVEMFQDLKRQPYFRLMDLVILSLRCSALAMAIRLRF